MIIPDVNLLIYAYDVHSSKHPEAKHWLESLMNGDSLIGIPWASILGFIRISTSPNIFPNPVTLKDSENAVRSWLSRRETIIVHPGDQHADILFHILKHAGTAGNLTTDAHLAALAIEHQAELHSTDADMSRFPGLKWFNPLMTFHRSIPRSGEM